jgi:hypothetical protein
MTDDEDVRRAALCPACSSWLPSVEELWAHLRDGHPAFAGRVTAAARSHPASSGDGRGRATGARTRRTRALSACGLLRPTDLRGLIWQAP